MVVSKQNLDPKFINQSLDNLVSESQLQQFLEQLQIIEPNPGELFWSCDRAGGGLYLILTGKVRLIDHEDNLIASLSEGWFGQISLFGESGWQPYSLRAAIGLKLAYLDRQSVKLWLNNNPQLQDYFYRQGKKWDLLLLCQQVSGEKSVEDLLPILPLLRGQQLQPGILSSELRNRTKLWLLRQGEMVHESGLKLVPGQIYDSDRLPSEGEWLTIKPTELYTLEKDIVAKPSVKTKDIPLPAKIASLKQLIPEVKEETTQAPQPYFPSPRVKIAHWWQQSLQRYPLIKQHSNSDCGVACLVMIGQYWGKNFSINQLREVANVDRSGASIKGLIAAAESVGFISHTFNLPLKYFETRYVGDITSRINENRKIRRFITGDAITTILDVLSVFIYIALMFWYSWQMSLLALVVVPVFAVVTVFATPFLVKVSRESFNASTEEKSYLIEALTGVDTIKSMGVEQTVRWRWEDLINKSIRISFSGQMISERVDLCTSLIETTVSSLVLIFGVWQVIQNQLTIGQLIAFNMLVGNVISPLKRLISLWNDFQEIRIAIERTDDVINTEAEAGLSGGNLVTLPPIKGQICFENVTFRYNLESEANTIENLSFAIQPGQTIALVGRSGSGKTTISKLLLGLYPPVHGKITIDGYDITKISLKSLRQQTGVVNQNTFLFGGTILENLTIGHPKASQKAIEEATRLAGAAEFIEELPLKYNSQVGEGGGLLSGGQRQRLAIARALLGKPRLLILDEATSNLDAESEQIIQNNFNTILKNQTTVVIAHRLSTVRNADLILVMDQGVLVESGTHEELMAQRGQYFHLNQQQLAIAN